MMPGTLWCGAGSVAENYTNLGIFHGADVCCREHDFCSHQIQRFEFQYGIRNYRLHTISHCDCDQGFRSCLQSINDTMSALIGIMYFNILEMPCFTLREEEQCVEWHWWGGCKSTGLVPTAELQKQAAFNYTHPVDTLTPTPSLHHSRQTAAFPLTPSSHRGKLTSTSSLVPGGTANRKKLRRKERQRQNARDINGLGERDNPVLRSRKNKAHNIRKNKAHRRRENKVHRRRENKVHRRRDNRGSGESDKLQLEGMTKESDQKAAMVSKEKRDRE
ncbi:group 3 secretory phospholipase A2-like [Discoglossus pictus]